jgi:hypothetical protein
MAGGGVSPCLTLEALPKTQKGGWLATETRDGPGARHKTEDAKNGGAIGLVGIVLVYGVHD